MNRWHATTTKVRYVTYIRRSPLQSKPLPSRHCVVCKCKFFWLPELQYLPLSCKCYLLALTALSKVPLPASQVAPGCHLPKGNALSQHTTASSARTLSSLLWFPGSCLARLYADSGVSSQTLKHIMLSKMIAASCLIFLDSSSSCLIFLDSSLMRVTSADDGSSGTLCRPK